MNVDLLNEMEKVLPWGKFYMAIMAHPSLSNGAKLTYLTLRFYARDKRECYPNQETVAAILNCSTRALKKYIAELRAVGAITVRRRGLGKGNIYQFPFIGDVEGIPDDWMRNSIREHRNAPQMGTESPVRRGTQVPKEVDAGEVDAGEEETTSQHPVRHDHPGVSSETLAATAAEPSGEIPAPVRAAALPVAGQAADAACGHLGMDADSEDAPPDWDAEEADSDPNCRDRRMLSRERMGASGGEGDAEALRPGKGCAPRLGWPARCAAAWESLGVIHPGRMGRALKPVVKLLGEDETVLRLSYYVAVAEKWGGHHYSPENFAAHVKRFVPEEGWKPGDPVLAGKWAIGRSPEKVVDYEVVRQKAWERGKREREELERKKREVFEQELAREKERLRQRREEEERRRERVRQEGLR